MEEAGTREETPEERTLVRKKAESVKIVGDAMIEHLIDNWDTVAEQVKLANGEKSVSFTVKLVIKPSKREGLDAEISSSVTGNTSSTLIRASLDDGQMSFSY